MAANSYPRAVHILAARRYGNPAYRDHASFGNSAYHPRGGRLHPTLTPYRAPPPVGHLPLLVFRLVVQAEFCAAHALTVRGEREPLHGHNWRVEAVVEGPDLDQDGLLCDFHAVASALGEVIAPLNNADLNEAPPLAGLNPTAEAVARTICQGLAVALENVLAPGARVARVSVTEAPGCRAEYQPEP
jgi:6-pyruvoyltetrahydropterin/6-carboxytetrahydropterin synthase